MSAWPQTLEEAEDTSPSQFISLRFTLPFWFHQQCLRAWVPFSCLLPHRLAVVETTPRLIADRSTGESSDRPNGASAKHEGRWESRRGSQRLKPTEGESLVPYY